MAGYKITFNVSDFDVMMGHLIGNIQKRRPMMRALAGDMIDAVEENFAQQGRPAWAGWSPRYARKRKGGKILQRSGRLAASISSHSDNDSASVGTNVVYARIHQEGGTVNIASRSQQAYYRQHKNGRVSNRFVKKSKSNYSEWNTIGAYKITMPARPFLHLTESDIERLEETAADYIDRSVP
ncbi:phage virion morphogenesis protein [Erwinia psidii]|uniref:phage virion morphogenesis protein n=1 Tax=Erwinia psidii TaxID=69224 RepID=UPI003979C250